MWEISLLTDRLSAFLHTVPCVVLGDFRDFRHYEGDKVVTLTRRPPSPPGVSWYSFLEAESTAGHMVPSVASEKPPSDNNW
jgi:hypothetical protein